MTQRQDITAIIYDRRGRVLSIGKNNYLKTHPMQAKYANKTGEIHKIWLHAEIHAITRCKDIQLAHRIVVFRYNRNGEPALSKPCATCMAALAHTPIKVVEHT